MQKICTKFHCKNCDYKCSRKFLWKQHLKTKKHNGNIWKHLETKNMHFCSCGRTYKTRGGLYKHKKNCAYTVEKPTFPTEAPTTDTNLILQAILKENQELRKEMKNIKSSYTINNNNQKININVFLNEHCKNAICLEDFIKNLQLSLQDVSKTANLGFTEGVSNILIKNLNNMPVIQRPIHCSDVKRQKFYIKDKKGWYIDISNQKVDKAIEEVSHKQFHKIKDWQEVNSDWSSNDKKLKEWQQMVQKLSGPTNDDDMEKETKNIKRKIGETTGIKEAMSTMG
uniref:C2H2-type domain-containing protein n=1 Tax=viral metagenome TaxID=1070528 RepID=A0A6C0C752_9ZZZZ